MKLEIFSSIQLEIRRRHSCRKAPAADLSLLILKIKTRLYIDENQVLSNSKPLCGYEERAIGNDFNSPPFSELDRKFIIINRERSHCDCL